MAAANGSAAGGAEARGEAMDHGRVFIDFSGAEIRGNLEGRNPPIFFPRLRTAASPLVALDLGGKYVAKAVLVSLPKYFKIMSRFQVNFVSFSSTVGDDIVVPSGTLIKLVYTRSSGDGSDGAELRFATFEKHRLEDCFEFIRAEGLVPCKGTWSGSENIVLKATGGGAYYFADDFQEKLHASLDNLHEFECIVSGANILLKNIPGTAFTYMDGKITTIDASQNNLFPYLIVHIGTCVTMIKVIGNKKFEFATSTNIGGAFVFGLARLLTGCKSYDEFLQLCQKGDNSFVDLLVKDICGELVSQKQGLSASTLASSFAKVLTSKKKLEDYRSEDLASALLTAFTYNIAQVAFLVASLLGLQRIAFSGSFICGQKSIMETISNAINVWSLSQIQAIFLRHEGYLGAIGALMSYADRSPESPRKGFSDECLAHIDRTSAHQQNAQEIFPYLLINVGPGIGMTEVFGIGKFKRIIGSHLGGGTILGLAKLLTGCSSYDEFLELSHKGDNLRVDLTVKDIVGEEDCHKFDNMLHHGIPMNGFPTSFVIGSFGKVNSSKISDYKIEDLSASLLNCFVYNTGQITYLVTKLLGVKKIFFHGSFICGHENIMDKISCFLEHRLKGEVQLTFICHEGFLGTRGEFLSYDNMGIHDVVGNEGIREIILGTPYTGQFQSLAQQQKDGGNKRLDGEEENLWHDILSEGEVELLPLQRENVELKAKLVDNAMLKAELERLRRENAELNAKLVRSSEPVNL
ncbi:hypothetical protein EJB05_16091, partial [Eragrostis curvula]